MNSSNPKNPAIVADVENWVAEVVVRHRFCPFAKPALDAQSVSYAVLDGVATTQVLEQLADRMAAMLESYAPDHTQLLILSASAKTFDEFLDLAALAEALIESMSWEDQIQLATFHPDYCFADTSPHSIENYTNRAPWPVLQLLQVESVGRAIDTMGGTEHIPQRNVELLQALDDEATDQIMRNSTAPVSNSGVPRH